jgi:hypothetical protein
MKRMEVAVCLGREKDLMEKAKCRVIKFTLKTDTKTMVYLSTGIGVSMCIICIVSPEKCMRQIPYVCIV